MEYRQLGASGFKVPVLSLGCGTFGGVGEFFGAWGNTQAPEATRLVDVCLEAGLNMFDTADGYSAGQSEIILGQAIKGRRDKVIISTKATFRFGQGPNDVGSSRYHLVRQIDGALKRLNTDFIDLFQLHAFDAMTPIEEVLSTLDGMVKAGKIRYLGVSNFSGWHLMKSLAIAEKYGLSRYVAHQAYYSLIGRDYEWELMPLAIDQKVSAVVWSPLGWGRLTGKIRRGAPAPQNSRSQSKLAMDIGPQVDNEYVYKVVDALDEVCKEVGKSVPQVALNWLMQRPTVANIIIGARNEEQLKQNLGAVGWNLTPAQVKKLDEASAIPFPYPYWHQQGFKEAQPLPGVTVVVYRSYYTQRLPASDSPNEDFVPSDQYSSYNAPDEGPSVAGYASIPLAWLVPGLGHFLIGERVRGIVFFLTIHLLFAGGLLIGGMRSIKPTEQPIWTYTQYLAGWPMLVSNKLWDGFQRTYLPLPNGAKSNAEAQFDRDAPPVPDLTGKPTDRIEYTKDFIAAHPPFAFHPKVHDMGSVFCGIAGMLNLLVMFDVLLRVTGSVREDPAAARRKMREATRATTTPMPPPTPPAPPATGGTR